MPCPGGGAGATHPPTHSSFRGSVGCSVSPAQPHYASADRLLRPISITTTDATTTPLSKTQDRRGRAPASSRSTETDASEQHLKSELLRHSHAHT